MSVSDVERFLLAANFGSDKSTKMGTILRYEFTECIVRIAECKYMKAGVTTKYGQAV